jgi:regulator of protease activity HflC (stomatin/prohibitin superfamily)
MFSRELQPGEVLASHRLGSRRVEKLYDKPGRHWIFPNPQLSWEFVRVNEPVFVTSEPTEIQVQGGVSVILTVRLTMDVANPARYISVVIGQELEDWRRQVLPGLLAHAASSYTVTQVLNDRGEVSSSVAQGIDSWLADSRAPDLGLAFRAAAITNAATRANRPPRARD